MRPIDADHLKQRAKAPDQNGFTTFIDKVLCGLIDSEPTVDTMSCKGCKHKGRWENEFENGYPSPCTNCKRRASDNWEKMDGKEQE